MALKCPHCGSENEDKATFCFQCGKQLEMETEMERETSSTENTVVEEVPNKKPRRGVRRAIGCLVISLILLIGLPTAYIFLGRPLVEREIMDIAESTIEDNPVQAEYRGRIRNLTVDEDDINEEFELLWSEIPLIDRGSIELQQDSIVAAIEIISIPLQADVDIRVDDEGDVIIKDLNMNLPLSLIFQKRTLVDQIPYMINENYLREGNIAFRAFQVTEGEIFITFEER